jgi:hypothetical protein
MICVSIFFINEADLMLQMQPRIQMNGSKIIFYQIQQHIHTIDSMS